MCESLEYKTVLSCFDKLVTALKLDSLAVSNELVAESLIPPGGGVIDAQKLAQLLLERIQLSPKRYYDVIKVFSRHDWLGDIVDILQEEHSILEGASTGVQMPGSEEESVSNSSIPLPKPVERPCDDSFKLVLDCPHRQASLPIPNPIVRFEELSEDDREDLFAQMHELTKKIVIKFKKLLKQVFRSLTEHVRYTDVVVTLTGDDAMIFDDDDIEKLDKAKDMFEVFKAIRPHYSYFNYDILKSLVDIHGTPEDKKCFDDYLKSFDSYCQAMPCAEEVCGSDDSRPNRMKINFKLNFDRQRLKVDHVKDIIRNIARILDIKPSSLYLRSIKEGCVSLEILVPAILFDRFFLLTSNQIISLYREVKVIAIQCDQLNRHKDVETQAKHSIVQMKFESSLETDVGSTTYIGGQATSGHSSGGLSSGYSSRSSVSGLSSRASLISGLSSVASSFGYSSGTSSSGFSSRTSSMESHNVPAKYQRTLTSPRPAAKTSLHQLHKMEDRRAASLVDYRGHSRQLEVESYDTVSTASNEASSGNSSSAASIVSGYQEVKTPERFDYGSFLNNLLEVRKQDPQWKQLGKEELHHWRELIRLREEVKQLEDLKKEVKGKEIEKDIELKLKLKTLERDLAASKELKAFYQLGERGRELMREMLSQELKVATNDDMKIEIQRRLEEAERGIHARKAGVNECEHEINQYEENLVQLRKESHHPSSPSPLSSKLSLEDEGHDTTLLQTETEPPITSTPASSSPVATAHYICPSCGAQYKGDKGEEGCTSCSDS